MEKRVKNHYPPPEFIAMFVIAGIVIFAQILTTIHFDNQEKNAEIINISGRQRMFSQKLLRLALEFKITKDRSISQKSEEIIKRFEKTNEKLLTNSDYNVLNTQATSLRLKSLTKVIQDIKQDLVCIYSRCPSSSFHFKSLMKKSEDFLEKMELIVADYETKTKKRMEWVKYSEIFFMLLLTIVLFLLGFKLVANINREQREKVDKLSKKYNLTSEIERVASIGSWELDVAFERTTWSDEIYRIHEIPLGTPTNKIEALEYYAEHDRERITQCLNDCITLKKKYDEDFDFIDAKGIEKRVRAIGEPVVNKKGEVYKLVGVFQDITESYLKEKELEKQTKMANLNSKLASIGSLAAGVGHEINNPLAIIKGYMELIQDKVSPDDPNYDDIVEKFNKCHTGVDRIAKIVTGLRALSHSSNREGNIFSSNEAIKNSLSMIKEIYLLEGIKITFEGLEDSYILGDQVGFSQVIMNLISNAKDATEGKKERLINVKIFRADNNVAISVWDNGSGIPKEVKNKIFDPFFTTKGVNKGVGIGLSISHSIVKKYDGDIECQSSDEGTIFTLFFPVQENPMPIVAEEDKNELSYTPENLRILLLDDEPEIRFILGEILEDIGHEVASFGDGLSALKYLKSHSVDLIISDVKMPIMNGEQFFYNIQELGIDVKFFFSTGGMNPEKELSKEILTQVDGILYKPYEHQTLMKIIGQCFKSDHYKKSA